MSYEYRIVPRESFKVRHNCSGCGMKSIFENTCCFRINANRKKIDVWLIYQCTKCRHPLNLTIYERKNSAEIDKKEYEKFLENDYEYAMKFGKDKSFFQKNTAVIAWNEAEYDYLDHGGNILDFSDVEYKSGDYMLILNEYGLSIRDERIIADVLNCSRSYVKVMLRDKKIRINKKGNGMLIQINY